MHFDPNWAKKIIIYRDVHCRMLPKTEKQKERKTKPSPANRGRLFNFVLVNFGESIQWNIA